ncbi:hypothetical protein DTO164E3_3008 [Paecilomyces variotii]|nr:hypothetical protein DTO032I3_4607 [Paecilomyces variotii]KAJ9202568.1 hypothetical protein DTO164E3_3008 [Paecilomyces variotii]KAJ9283022.1 hypothetical protein DTO021D3_359 [Paecilomyces variotii]KAJ9343780.1 hypothetical protein DTO027B6_3605 [Paecilomyces variotii]KAJ9387017.1 hypothetical protein DTO032I4_3461 [Paecilomyces variotii]
MAAQERPLSSAVLDDENDASQSKHRWFSGLRLPRYVIASITVACAAMLFGLDTGCIGPVTTMPEFLGSFGQFSSTIHGAIVSTILITASVTSFFAGHLSEILGRERAVIVGTTVFSFGAAIEAGATSLGMFVGGRAVKGVGEGFFLSTLTVYICEVSPASRRGSLASLVQFLTTIGICVGFFMCYGTVRIASSVSWRLPSAIQSALAAILAAACSTLPPSPRWLVNKRRYTEACDAMDKLGLPRGELELDSAILSPSSTSSSLTDIETMKTNRFAEVFTKPYWKQTVIGMFMMVMCQFSGIDGVLYYAPTLFKQAGLSSTSSSFLASGITGILGVVVTIPASLLADRWNRRTSLIAGGLAIGACMVVIGSLYASNSVHPNSGAGRWVVIISIYLYTIFFGISWGVTIKIYSTEVQPARTRAAASSLGQGVNWVANFLVAFTTPIFLAHSSCGAYYFFGSWNLLTALVCVFFMPETKGRSLEAIEASFHQSAVSDIFSRFLRKDKRSSSESADVNIPVEVIEVK